MHTKEVWKDVKGYEGLYKVSSFGRVKSLKRKHIPKSRILKPIPNKKDYLTVVLCIKSVNTRFYIHRLVMLNFDPINTIMQVNHKDGFKCNNNLYNLEWCTATENINHAFDMGLITKGELNPNYKLTDMDIIKIRNIAKKGFWSQSHIAKKFNVSQAMISKIINNKKREI